jgi:hypothetical protein
MGPQSPIAEAGEVVCRDAASNPPEFAHFLPARGDAMLQGRTFGEAPRRKSPTRLTETS